MITVILAALTLTSCTKDKIEPVEQCNCGVITNNYYYEDENEWSYTVENFCTLNLLVEFAEYDQPGVYGLGKTVCFKSQW